MTRIGPVLMLILVTTAVAGEQRGSAMLQGRVTDSQGCVVPGATVTVTNTEGNTSTGVTNTRGEYRIEGLQPGKVTTSVRMAGFVTANREWFVYRGQNLWDTGLIVGRLADGRQLRISGVVRDANGHGIANATVTVLSAFGNEIVEQLRSNADGRYVFVTQDAGPYVVTAAAPGFDVQSRVASPSERGGLDTNLTLHGTSICSR